jgi:hypothetical protein
MPDRIRIYHPETNEPFDLPVDKATDLRLNHGWLQAQPDHQGGQPEESGIGTISSHRTRWKAGATPKSGGSIPEAPSSRSAVAVASPIV